MVDNYRIQPPDEQVIFKDIPRPESMDFAFLRKEGIRFLQDLVGQVWTDFNIHDPGVTILEVLCYALTEMAYRTDFPIKDVLASHPGKGTDFLEDFSLPDDILPMAPLTRLDYKKLLLDITGVRNAWFEKSTESEQPLAANLGNPPANGAEKLILNGLYLIVLELEQDPQLGDIHNNIIQRAITIPSQRGNRTFRIEIAHPYWDEIDDLWRETVTVSGVTIRQFTPFVDSRTQEYFISLVIDVDQGQFQIGDFELRIKFIDRISPIIEPDALEVLRNLVSDPAQILRAFNRKMQAVYRVLDEIEARLHANRNLSEDYYQIKAARVQEIGIEATIRIEPGTDADRLLAKIIFGLTRFFSPKAKFRSLGEMLETGKSLDQIFEGPLLEHGFLLENELEPFAREGVVFTSDVVHVLMDIGGVMSVENFSMTNYINNQIITAAAEDSLILPRSKRFKPKLSIEKSNIVLLKSDIRQDTDNLRLKDFLRQIKQREEKKRSVGYREELDFPAGQRLDLATYHTIQNDFPENYGIGTIGLPESATKKRKAQAVQLKAYLLFYEQLITNFFAQLAHMRDLFSTDDTIRQTYFYQPLYQVPGIALLLKDFIEHAPAFPGDRNFLEAWNQFRGDPHNAYLAELSTVMEDRKLFNRRRNQFLNHLLARFCEDFTDYSLSVFASWGSNLIRDKISFLKDWMPSSAGRNIAFNYRLKDANGGPQVWKDDNLSALSRKLSHLLGITGHHRRNLSADVADKFERLRETDSDGNKWFRFRLRGILGNIHLTGVNAYRDRADLEQDIEDVVRQGSRRTGYRFDRVGNGRYTLKIVSRQNRLLAEISQTVYNLDDAENTRDQLIAYFHQHEGFYLIEHILLRPKFSGRYANKNLTDQHIKIFERDDGQKIPIADPYSFRVSFLFPGWTPKFSDPDFKVYVNSAIVRELPAHIIAHIFFLSKGSMKQFESAYKTWLELYCLELPLEPNERDLHIIASHSARAKLVKRLNAIAQSA